MLQKRVIQFNVLFPLEFQRSF